MSASATAGPGGTQYGRVGRDDRAFAACLPIAQTVLRSVGRSTLNR